MKKLNSLLFFLAMLTALPALPQSTVTMASFEDLEAIGLATSSDRMTLSAGTVIVESDAGSFGVAYEDEWHSASTYRNYRTVKVGSDEEIVLDQGIAGNANPTFDGYQYGVMSAGAVFEIKAKKDGWMTVFTSLNPNKQYLVYEGKTGALPFTLGVAGDGYRINYTVPSIKSGSDSEYIDFDSPDASRYFTARGEDGFAPQFPYLVAGMEEVPATSTGFLTFRVKGGETYYISGLGTKMACQGFVLTETEEEPVVTFCATETLPEVKFKTGLSDPDVEDPYTPAEPIISGNSTIVMASLEDLEAAELWSEKTERPGGTVILNTTAGSLSLAYDDLWGRGLAYRNYRTVKIGDSDEISLGSGAVGDTNPSFISYEQGAPTAGAVFEIKPQKDGWMTVFTRMNPNKQYLVFEGKNRGIPYTLGTAGDGYMINYTMPFHTGGFNAGLIDLSDAESSKYFTTAQKQSKNEAGVLLWYGQDGQIVAGSRPVWNNDETGAAEEGSPVWEDVPGEHAPQFPYLVAGMQTSPEISTGFLTFKVKAGETYYISGIGSKMSCQGFVLTETEEEPPVTFCATETLPEVKFDTRPAALEVGDDFECDGIRYTVLDMNVSVIGNADGSEESENLFSYNPESYLQNSPIVSDSERGSVYKCDILANPENPWDSQLFIKSNKAFKAGQHIKVSFMYKCTDERDIDTQAHGEPFEYHHWQCIGTLKATPEWQEYSWSGMVEDEWIGDNGFISIAFNLAGSPEAATFFIDDIVFEEMATCMTATGAGDAMSAGNMKGEVVIPSIIKYYGVEYSVIGIGDSSFKGNTELTSISLPESVISIGASAFEGCVGLTSINLPKHLETIGKNAFSGCSQIESVTYIAVNPIEATEDIFEPEVYQSATLNMPEATLDDIKKTMPWAKFEHVKTKDGAHNMSEKLMGVMYPGPSRLNKWGHDYSTELTTDENGGECFKVTHSGIDDSWRAQLAYDRLYQVGETYFFTFDVKGDPGVITSNFQDCTTEDYTTCGVCEDFEVTPQWATVTIKGTVEGNGTIVNRWVVNFGDYDGTFFIRNMKIYAYVNDAVNPPVADDEIIVAELYPGLSQLLDWGDGMASMIDMDEDGKECLKMTNSVPDSPSSARFAFDYPYEIGKTYFFKFDVKGDQGIVTSEFENSQTNNNCGTCNDFEITPEWNTVIVKGKPEDKGESVNRWVANIGEYVGTMYIRNMKIYTLVEEPIAAGDTFTYDGINYAVVDPDANTCKAIAPNSIDGEFVVPEAAKYREIEFLVNEVGDGAFAGNDDLRSVTIPASITHIGTGAFADCERLTSLVWLGNTRLDYKVVEEIGNPNLLVYVDTAEYAPAGMESNVVVDGVCRQLDLTPGYAFTPLKEFTALRSRMVKEFTQKTYPGICAGWETIVLPFDVAKVYAENIDSEIVPFSAVTDRYSQRPYWLYEADEVGDWKEAAAIRAGIPYIISMPNNSSYPAYANISGPVVFSNDAPQRITTATTAPYAVTWTSGSEFRSLWLPLEETEKPGAMGINSGIDYLTGDDGLRLPAGSAFHAAVVPSPLEAYVTRAGAERARKVMGSQSAVLTLQEGAGLMIHQDGLRVMLKSTTDRTVEIFGADGTLLRIVSLQAGQPAYVDGLPYGVCLIAGRKVMVR